MDFDGLDPEGYKPNIISTIVDLKAAEFLGIEAISQT